MYHGLLVDVVCRSLSFYFYPPFPNHVFSKRLGYRRFFKSQRDTERLQSKIALVRCLPWDFKRAKKSLASVLSEDQELL